jgi:hypothetical protein
MIYVCRIQTITKVRNEETITSVYGYGKSALEAKTDLCAYLDRLGVTSIRVVNENQPLQIAVIRDLGQKVN